MRYNSYKSYLKLDWISIEEPRAREPHETTNRFTLMGGQLTSEAPHTFPAHVDQFSYPFERTESAGSLLLRSFTTNEVFFFTFWFKLCRWSKWPKPSEMAMLLALLLRWVSMLFSSDANYVWKTLYERNYVKINVTGNYCDRM